MAIPDFQTIMLPFLKFLTDKNEHSFREIIDGLAEKFKLSNEERRELLPSGKQSVFYNRVGWARKYLKEAYLLESPRRGVFKITKRGLDVILKNPQKINIDFLKQFPEFEEFRAPHDEKPVDEELAIKDIDKTPEEILENTYQNLRHNLANDLLQQIKSSPPGFFERIVVELIVSMGYGGSLKDAGKIVGKSGDEGIDGIIKEDRLGLDVIYIQAKRWDTTVSKPEIQKFAGALLGQKAKKGIFITTSDFTKGAHDFVSKIDSKIVLIDGEQLTQFMIDHNIGVTTVANYELKRIDLDYFTEDLI